MQLPQRGASHPSTSLPDLGRSIDRYCGGRSAQRLRASPAREPGRTQQGRRRQDGDLEPHRGGPGRRCSHASPRSLGTRRPAPLRPLSAPGTPRPSPHGGPSPAGPRKGRRCSPEPGQEAAVGGWPQQASSREQHSRRHLAPEPGAPTASVPLTPPLPRPLPRPGRPGWGGAGQGARPLWCRGAAARGSSALPPGGAPSSC